MNGCGSSSTRLQDIDANNFTSDNIVLYNQLFIFECEWLFNVYELTKWKNYTFDKLIPYESNN